MAKLCPTRGEDRIVILSLVFVLDYCFNQGCDLMGGNRKRENKENEGKKRKKEKSLLIRVQPRCRCQ